MVQSNDIIEIRRGPTKRERQALNVRVQRQKERIAELEGVLASLGGHQKVRELLKLERDFGREVKRIRKEQEQEMRELREDLDRERRKFEIAVERIARLENVQERIRNLASMA